MNKEPSSSQVKKNRPLLTDAILALIIPVAGYYLAYRYEQGYLSYFSVPVLLVEVGLTEVLGVIGQLIIIFLLILGYLDFRATLSKEGSPVARAIGRVLFPIIVLLLIIYATSVKGTTLYLLLSILALIVLFEFVFPIFSQRKVKGYKTRLEKQELKEGAKNSLMNSLLSSYNKEDYALKYTINLTMVLSLLYIFFLGSFSAKHAVSFMVIKSSPELIVIRKYSNRLICAEFDRNMKTIKREFHILNIDEIEKDKVIIVQENIGPLKVVKPENGILNRDTKKDPEVNIINLPPK